MFVDTCNDTILGLARDVTQSQALHAQTCYRHGGTLYTTHFATLMKVVLYCEKNFNLQFVMIILGDPTLTS